MGGTLGRRAARMRGLEGEGRRGEEIRRLAQGLAR